LRASMFDVSASMTFCGREKAGGVLHTLAQATSAAAWTRAAVSAFLPASARVACYASRSRTGSRAQFLLALHVRRSVAQQDGRKMAMAAYESRRSRQLMQ